MLLKEGCPTSVTLANARAHAHPLAMAGRGATWVPACAGMTMWRGDDVAG